MFCSRLRPESRLRRKLGLIVSRGSTRTSERSFFFFFENKQLTFPVLSTWHGARKYGTIWVLGAINANWNSSSVTSVSGSSHIHSPTRRIVGIVGTKRCCRWSRSCTILFFTMTIYPETTRVSPPSPLWNWQRGWRSGLGVSTLYNVALRARTCMKFWMRGNGSEKSRCARQKQYFPGLFGQEVVMLIIDGSIGLREW
jgi:hypothetical protein